MRRDGRRGAESEEGRAERVSGRGQEVLLVGHGSVKRSEERLEVGGGFRSVSEGWRNEGDLYGE